MALVKCPECGRANVSDTAIACPDCGYGIKEHFESLSLEVEKKVLQERIDSETQRKKAEDLESKRLKEEKKKENASGNKKKIILFMSIILIVIFCCGINWYLQSDGYKYKQALRSYEDADYETAIIGFTEICDFKDSAILLDESKYKLAESYYQLKQYDKSMETLELVENIDTTSLMHMIFYDEGRSCMLNGEYESAYSYFLRVDEESLLANDLYFEGDLEEGLTECREKVAVLGKESYEKEDYVSAYRYWTICCSTSEGISYDDEYNLCQLVMNVQGIKYDRQNFSNTITVDNTTIVVKSRNVAIANGTYTTHLEKYTNKMGDEEWGLFFDDRDVFLNLPDSEDSLISLINKETKKIDSYYSMEGARIANDEVAGRNKSEPKIGMTKEKVEESTWGKPKDINKTTYSWGTTEQWCYSNNRYIYFEDGIVIAISE